jgi:hypothetical protein
MPKYTFYIDKASEVAFPMINSTPLAGQSMRYHQIQNTAPLTSSPSNGVGYGNVTAIKTTSVNQERDINANFLWMFNMNGSVNGVNGGDIPPYGTLVVNFPFHNGTSVPTSASSNPSEDVPNGVSADYDGTIVSDLCTGDYLRATGTAKKTKSNTDPYRKYVVEVNFA